MRMKRRMYNAFLYYVGSQWIEWLLIVGVLLGVYGFAKLVAK